MSGLELDVDHFRTRVLQDALTQATSAYWLRRAATLEAARHRPGVDFRGRASDDELRVRWVELTAAAAACRARAAVGLGADALADIDDVLRAVA